MGRRENIKVIDGQIRMVRDVKLDGLTLKSGKMATIVGLSFGGYVLLEYGPEARKERVWVHPSKLE